MDSPAPLATPSTSPPGQETPPPASSPTASPQASDTPRPSPTATRSDTATPQPTRTPSATPTATRPPVVEAGQVPEGFSVIRYAAVNQPTSLAFDAQGRLFVASNDGHIYLVQDADGDGRGEVLVYATGFETPLGLLLRGTDLYVSSSSQVAVLSDPDGDGRPEPARVIISGLPNGRHQNDGMAWGPDGRLYLGVGSTCDACVEPDPRSATIMRFAADGSGGEVFARGLRNPYDLAFYPGTADLFATDNGRDDLGEDQPPEELNWIVEGGHYGWPDCWDDGQGPGCQGTRPPVATFRARSSADGLVFYDARVVREGATLFPAAYHDNAFVAVVGSWEVPAAFPGLARVVFTRDAQGYHGAVSWFATGLGKPLDVTLGADGALYVGDFELGMIYRISYGAP